MVAFEALLGEETVGLDLWYLQGDIAYGHLAAFSKKGYESRASYATKWFMIEYFADKAKWIDLGAGAGTQTKTKGGLTAFKEGWATGIKPVYFCGKILRPEVYAQLSNKSMNISTTYFPAYRNGEFS